MIEHMHIPGAPAPRGPYTPAVRAGDFLFLSGMVATDPITNEFVPGSTAQQTRATLNNIQRLLEGCGARIEDVVKCSVFLLDAADFQEMNAVYAEFFPLAKPARTTVAATLMDTRLRVEIECIAYLVGAPDRSL
jgi:2-iminobutanoate/2-iminopropanoate deaminase